MTTRTASVFGDVTLQLRFLLRSPERFWGVASVARMRRPGLETVLAEKAISPLREEVIAVPSGFGHLIVRYSLFGPSADTHRLEVTVSQQNSEQQVFVLEAAASITGSRYVGHSNTAYGEAALELVAIRESPIEELGAPHAAPASSPNARRSREPAQERLIRDYTVWFGTNRTPILRGDKIVDFAEHRSDVVRLGRCKVAIPKSHDIGSLGSSFWTRLRTGVDDRLVVKEVTAAPADSVWEEIRSVLSESAELEREAVVFLHGFNVNFKHAAVRAAQLGADLGVSGVMAFYSWPSKGRFRHYAADEASVEASEDAITEYLVSMATRVQARKVHIIAHSMGNRGLLRALNRIAANAATHTGVRFSQIVVAAADVDRDTFRSLCSAYSAVADRTTMYVSPIDKALRLSGAIHQYPRAGFTPPISVFPGVDTVSVGDLDLDGLAHGYVADSRALLSDIHTLFRHGTPPSGRFGLREDCSPEGTYWAFDR